MSELKPIRIATRGSALALAQAHLVLAQCRAAFPAQPFELQIIKTTGDKLLTASLASSDLAKGLFTKEIEEALLRGEADLAVHSLKDLPTDLPAELRLGAVSPRVDVRDVLVHRANEGVLHSLRDLPRGATVATSSTRRSAQALDLRPDLKVVPIRGNVGTRLKKVAEQPELAATLLAAAGLERLQFRIEADGSLRGEGVPAGLRAARLDPSEMLPCVGQAALGIEVRAGDERIAFVCRFLDHAETHQCVLAERAYLQAMGGGCHLAVAALATVEGAEIWLRGVSFLSGKARRSEVRGATAEAVKLGQQLAAQVSG